MMPSRLLHFLHSLLRREQQHQAHSANCPQPQRRQFVSTLSGDFYVNHYDHVIYSSNNGNVYSTNITTHSADNTSTAITNAYGNGNISSRIVHDKETAISLWTMLLIYTQTPSWMMIRRRCRLEARSIRHAGVRNALRVMLKADSGILRISINDHLCTLRENCNVGLWALGEIWAIM